jgi:glycosyltransferase involved in cell wall biosynthesis
VRVLVVAAWPPWPINDGNRLILHHQLRALSPRHDITLVAGCRRGDEPAPPAGVPDGVAFEWYGHRGSGLPEYARRRWRSLVTGAPADVFRVHVGGLVDAVDRALTTRPDVVHLMGQETAFLAPVARAAGVPVVHMPIDAWRLAFGKQQLLPAWRRLLERGQHRKVARYEARHLAACDVVVVVAERDAAVLRAAVPGLRVEVVPNGVEPGPEPDLHRDPAPPRLPVIGLHGTMATLPNRTAAVTLADQVLPRVQASVPSARARIIGRDPAPDVLRLRRADVEVTGEVPDVRAELARLAVYVVPMTEGSGLKNKVLEAMAAGLPVVATPLAIDGIGPGGGIVVGDDAESLSAAVVDLLHDDDERTRVGAAGRARAVEEFSWARSAAQVEALWREVASVSESA